MMYVDLKEFRCKCCGQLPEDEQAFIEELVRNVLDPVLGKFGKPIKVNSGFRCPVHNGTIGASRQSAHVRGEAADITAGSPEENQVLYDILQSLGVCTELILHTTYIHVSL